MSGMVLGLDLSVTATGAATVFGETFTVQTKTEQGDKRLVIIRDALRPEVEAAELVVIEDLPTHANGSGITGMVQGVVRALCIDLGKPYVLITAATLKKFATGSGNATKPDMRMALYQRVGIDLRDDNQVDAWWLRAAGMDAVGVPLLKLPKAQRDALAKAKWPGGLATASA